MEEATGAIGVVAAPYAPAALLGGTVAFGLRHRRTGRDRDRKVTLIIAPQVLISRAAAAPRGERLRPPG